MARSDEEEALPLGGRFGRIWRVLAERGAVKPDSKAVRRLAQRAFPASKFIDADKHPSHWGIWRCSAQKSHHGFP